MHATSHWVGLNGGAVTPPFSFCLRMGIIICDNFCPNVVSVSLLSFIKCHISMVENINKS